MVAAAPARSGGLEFWFALAAGDAAWADPTERPSGTEQAVATLELAALGAVISTLWLMVSFAPRTTSDFVTWAPYLGTLGALALATRPLRLLLSRRAEARAWPSLAWRAVAVIAVVASLLVFRPSGGIWAAWALGLAIGAEAVLCAWEVGVDVRPLSWWFGFIIGPVHLGAVAALLVAAYRGEFTNTLHDAVPVAIMIHVAAVVACTTAWLLNLAHRQQVAHEASTAEAIAAAEHRRTAHWLHDDVASQLRIATLRLHSEQLSPHDVGDLLDDLDHRLRLRQLDEVLASGTANLAELIQPYVRDAQRHGVTIESVPSFDEASLTVDEPTGRLFARAVATLSTNAIQAGARHMSFEIAHDDESIRLAVVDDAGGFDLSEVPAGRGLWRLGQDVGRAHVRTETRGDGWAVTVTIPRRPRDRIG